MARARLLSATVLIFAVSACATPLLSPELDPELPSGGISVDRALEVTRNYGSSNGPEVIIGLRAGQFIDLSSVAAARFDNRWVWRVDMQGSYPRDCGSPRMTTPPPCPDAPFNHREVPDGRGDLCQHGQPVDGVSDFRGHRTCVPHSVA
jgi:hypothetical protein